MVMLAWLRYHWLVRRRARRLLRDHVASLPAPADVIDVTDGAQEPSRARAS